MDIRQTMRASVRCARTVKYFVSVCSLSFVRVRAVVDCRMCFNAKHDWFESNFGNYYFCIFLAAHSARDTLMMIE